MSLEYWNTVATCATCIVITTTAIIALVQLSHARRGNEIAALTELRSCFQSPEFLEACGFLATQLPVLLKDPEFRYQFANTDARTPDFIGGIGRARLVGNFFEDMGALMLAGLIDRDLTCMIYSGDVTSAWNVLQPLVAIQRRETDTRVWENFEYAASLSEQWLQAHPKGGFPVNVRRLPVIDLWAEEDRIYAQARNAGRESGTPEPMADLV